MPRRFSVKIVVVVVNVIIITIITVILMSQVLSTARVCIQSLW